MIIMNIMNAIYRCHVAIGRIKINYNQILFTSSIAPYGPSEEPKENSLLYKNSIWWIKLVGENYLLWQSNNFNKRLVIMGVYLDQLKMAMFQELIKAINRRYFFIWEIKKYPKTELCQGVVQCHDVTINFKC